MTCLWFIFILNLHLQLHYIVGFTVSYQVFQYFRPTNDNDSFPVKNKFKYKATGLPLTWWSQPTQSWLEKHAHLPQTGPSTHSTNIKLKKVIIPTARCPNHQPNVHDDCSFPDRFNYVVLTWLIYLVNVVRLILLLALQVYNFS